MNQPILQVQQNTEEEKAIDLTKYLGFFSDNRWLILGVAFVVTLLGVAYALVATPIYRANILIKVEDGNARPRNMPGDLSAPDATHDIKTAVASEMEVLRSRAVVSRAVDSGRFYINVQPKYFPAIGAWMARRSKGISEPGLFGYGGYVWGTEQAKVSVFNVPEELEGQPFVIVAEEGGAYTLKREEQGIEIRGRVGEALKKTVGSGELELLVDQLVAKPGAHFALTRSARLETIERLQEALNISERGKQSGIIDVALEGQDAKQTTAVLNEIGREYVRQNVDTKTEEAEKTLAFLNTQLPELKQELERAETKYNQLRNTRGTVDLGEEAKTVLQQSLQTQTRMVELKQKREELLTRFQPEHPSVLAIDQQMRELRRELTSVDGKIKKLPDVEQNVLRLSRDVKINTELYTALLSAAQQLRLATESNIGTVRLLDKAVTPIRPVKPKRAILVMLSGLVGLVLGVVVAFTRKMIYGRIDAPHEVEQLLGLPVTATIPHSPSQEQMYAQLQSNKKAVSMLPLDVPSDGTVESLRRFRTSLQFAMLEAKNNIVMIAGPTPGVGKSFVSANFAAVLASIGKKVLLIDGDLRSGHLHRYFGLDRRAGLADVITGKVMFGQAIQKSVAENVDFLSTGELPRKPAELLAHENFGKLLELLSTRYDYILIDTAPVLAVSDALVVASHAGAIFNVVRGGVSTAGEIEEAVKRLNQAGHTVTGVVFNDAKQRASRYEYGGTYGRYAEAAGRV
ncbi:MAG TPA: polysaccharide biosynthesis tyrosine autokinase [Noviherbaspirillum sp.]|nr:polysaccharide biosynthesis tyrosine autokinase [Noviherbaspirillum sp.]